MRDWAGYTVLLSAYRSVECLHVYRLRDEASAQQPSHWTSGPAFIEEPNTLRAAIRVTGDFPNNETGNTVPADVCLDVRQVAATAVQEVHTRAVYVQEDRVEEDETDRQADFGRHA